ncbi:peptide chain release factor N(5)-glutamine methyltransferase [Oceanisphaera avium]|uniref:Release factor glutamine methyltransferase n=1 Tax=Oceanisphaera avium TaxID=1903694 RepID=A0A1Y0CX19_9GAMM|nr:peptide chain release factor N(5)-glutamine methyltransferase [Oceanisphaera avium]ART79798.1 protein-(glutamine-N5) methyltransferase, release factor-specific [Oceanisphaera avium]
MTLAQWRHRLREQLTNSDTAALDADLLLCHVLAKPRHFLLSWPEYQLTAAQLSELTALVTRRKLGEPIAHLTKERGFWTLLLEVSADTLIPRPDTELMIEAALELLPNSPAKLVDLGTGTGAIALALKSERPHDCVMAVEFNANAVALAKRNSARLGLDIEVHHGSWFEPLAGMTFDMILSNPPYIDVTDPHLEQGDLRFEPASALVAPQAGLADLVHLIRQAPHYLTAQGWLLLEHGWQQGAQVRDYCTQHGYQSVQTRCDYGGNERITLAQWSGRLHV